MKSMTILYGWALTPFYRVDHTYVTSSEGHVWNCWGRSSGGTVICSGEADAGAADCISQKNSRAGIIYGITGVCHQTANRILLPANCIVSGAKNYWLTAFIYGTYGVRFPSSLLSFRKRIARCNLGAEDLPEIKSADSLRGNDEKLYIQRINSLYNHYGNMYRDLDASRERDIVPSLLGNELRITINYRLGSAAETATANKLVSYQEQLLQEKRTLDTALLKKSLSPVRYAKEVNELAATVFKGILAVLGDRNYTELFGLSPQEPREIVDPDIMEAANRK